MSDDNNGVTITADGAKHIPYAERLLMEWAGLATGLGVGYMLAGWRGVLCAWLGMLLGELG